MKKIAFVTDYVPNRDTGGSSLMYYTIIKFFAERGWQTKVFVVKLWNADPIHDSRVEKYAEALESIGVSCNMACPPATTDDQHLNVLYKKVRGLRRTILPRFEDYEIWFQTDRIAKAVIPMLDKEPFDWVIALDNPVVIALKNYEACRKHALLGDPMNRVLNFRLLQEPKRLKKDYIFSIINALQIRRLIPWLADAANHYTKSATFAANEVALFRKNGTRNCYHLQIPFEDTSGLADSFKLPIRTADQILQVIIVGQWISNYAGLRVLGNEILPALEKEGMAQRVEFRIIGRKPKNVPEDIERIVRHPSIKVLGFVEDINSEFMSADVLLYANYHPVGARSKIVNAFCFACTAVADASARMGLPEVIHNKNALLDSCGDKLARHLISLCENPSLLLELKQDARKTFMNQFVYSKACLKLESNLLDSPIT